MACARRVGVLIAGSTAPGVASAIALVAAGLLGAGGLVARGRCASAALGLAGLLGGACVLFATSWHTAQLAGVRHHAAPALVALAAAVVVVLGLALVLARRPGWLPVVAVALVPFRLPVGTGASSANLLLPLYVLVAASAIVPFLPARLRAAEPAREGPARVLDWCLAGSLVLYALQAGYSPGSSKAVQQLAFFYLPFALLYARLMRSGFSLGVLRRCLLVALGESVAFAAVGFYEYATRTVLFSSKTAALDQIEPYFRVNSIFFDPNIFGRFVALAMILATGLLLWSERGRVVGAATLLLAILWLSLVLSLSQSSIVALLVGLAVIGLLRWRAPRRALVTAACCVALLATGGVISGVVPTGSAAVNRASDGRLSLVSGGLWLFADRPFAGWGSGSFSDAYRADRDIKHRGTVSASHTIPITVAAEQGVLGLLLYAGLLAAAFLTLLRGAQSSAARAVIAAAFTAIVVHSLLYADFFEDPTTWLLLAAGACLASAPAGPEPPSRPTQQPAVNGRPTSESGSSTARR